MRRGAAKPRPLPRYDGGVRRPLLNFAAYLSLALCVLTAALWARGRITWGYDTAVWIGPRRKDPGQAQFNLSNSPFGIGVSHLTGRLPGTTPGWSFHSVRSTFADADAITEAVGDLGGRRIAGIWWARHLGRAGLNYRSVLVPHWMIVIVTDALPVFRLISTRRRQPGLCPACG